LRRILAAVRQRAERRRRRSWPSPLDPWDGAPRSTQSWPLLRTSWRRCFATAHASTRSSRRRGVQDVDIDNVRERRGGRGGCRGARLL